MYQYDFFFNSLLSAEDPLSPDKIAEKRLMNKVLAKIRQVLLFSIKENNLSNRKNKYNNWKAFEKPMIGEPEYFELANKGSKGIIEKKGKL